MAEVTLNLTKWCRNLLKRTGLYIEETYNCFSLSFWGTQDSVLVEPKRIYIQPNNYSCGAASLKTLMEYCGEEIDLGELLKLTQTTENGTPIGNLESVAERFGFHTEVKRDANLNDLIRNLRRGRIPLVGYMVNDEEIPEPHYSLVVGINGDRISIADCRTGNVETQNIQDFRRAWYEDKPPRTMLTIFRN